MRNYNVSGTERKALVNKIAELTGKKAVYLGMPSVAFRIGEFEVSRAGVLTWDDGTDAEKLIADLRTAGFRAEGDEEDILSDEITQDAAAEDQDDQCTEEIPEDTNIRKEDGSRDSSETAQDEQKRIPDPTVNNCEDKGEKSLKGQIEGEYYTDEEKNASGDDTEENRLSISVPDDLTDTQFTLLTRFVEGKETLLKHAFNSDSLAIERAGGKLTFPWFTASDGEHTQAYILFVTQMIRFIKSAKRVTAHDQPVPNERYAMRCLGLRLGLIGAECKTARKILLENLTGNTAWRDGRPEKMDTPVSDENEVVNAEEKETAENEEATA